MGFCSYKRCGVNDMGYCIDIDVNGFKFQFGEITLSRSLGVFIDFEDEKIKYAIDTKCTDFLNAIQSVFSMSGELDALYTMTNFERNYLQPHGWDSLKRDYNFNGLEEFKRKALIVLGSSNANEQQLNSARTIIDVLEGNYIHPPKPEKSPEQKARDAFERKKSKLRLKLTIRDGYKCCDCGLDKENSLCVVQKQVDNFNFEADNLVLRCRSCMNKARKK